MSTPGKVLAAVMDAHPRIVEAWLVEVPREFDVQVRIRLSPLRRRWWQWRRRDAEATRAVCAAWEAAQLALPANVTYQVRRVV